MKLRNLLLASLAVCTLASCSKDDDGPAVPQEMDAYLSIGTTASDLATKASVEGIDEVGYDSERVVNKLTALVFNGGDDNVTLEGKNATFVISKAINVDNLSQDDKRNKGNDDVVLEVINNQDFSISAIKNIHVKVTAAEGNKVSKTKFWVVLVANMDINNSSITNLADLYKIKTPDITNIGSPYLDNQTHRGGFLPMSSQKFLVQGLTVAETVVGEHSMNWYNGGSVYVPTGSVPNNEVPAEVTSKVTLTRAISRIQIEGLKSDFKAQYAGATFAVDSIYLVNLRATQTIMREEDTDAKYYRGGLEKYTVLDKLIDPESLYKQGFGKKYESDNLGSNVLSNATGTNVKFNDFISYIYVNDPSAKGGYQTRLIIAGDLALNGKNLGRKYFHIPLKDINGGNVVNNKIYKVTATITGEGNPEPDRILDNACINFAVTVEDWKVVNQNEEDIN